METVNMSLKPFNGVWKAVAVGQLKQLLATIPDDHHITVNDVENLSVLDAQGFMVGYIDIAQETYETATP
jgi:hypothetical protein